MLVNRDADFLNVELVLDNDKHGQRKSAFELLRMMLAFLFCTEKTNPTKVIQMRHTQSAVRHAQHAWFLSNL